MEGIFEYFIAVTAVKIRECCGNDCGGMGCHSIAITLTDEVGWRRGGIGNWADCTAKKGSWERETGSQHDMKREKLGKSSARV
jgi:hypothetical protein